MPANQYRVTWPKPDGNGTQNRLVYHGGPPDRGDPEAVKDTLRKTDTDFMNVPPEQIKIEGPMPLSRELQQKMGQSLAGQELPAKPAVTPR